MAGNNKFHPSRHLAKVQKHRYKNKPSNGRLTLALSDLFALTRPSTCILTIPGRYYGNVP